MESRHPQAKLGDTRAFFGQRLASRTLRHYRANQRSSPCISRAPARSRKPSSMTL
jgi:hypothetical protein